MTNDSDKSIVLKIDAAKQSINKTKLLLTFALRYPRTIRTNTRACLISRMGAVNTDTVSILKYLIETRDASHSWRTVSDSEKLRLRGRYIFPLLFYRRTYLV